MRYLLSIAAVALAIILLLSACSTSAPPAETTPSATDAALEELLRRYEAELALLRAELAALRGEDDAARDRCEARIEALEAVLSTLTGGGTNPAETQNTPEITANATVAPPRETVASPWVDFDQKPEMTAFHYRIEGNAAVICAYSGTESTVVIPADIDGYPVARIADNAFAGTGVRAVTVPATVTRIGWFAFYGCTALEAVILPISVTAIDYGAFDVCPALTLYVAEDSYAHDYAMAYGYACVVTD